MCSIFFKKWIVQVGFFLNFQNKDIETTSWEFNRNFRKVNIIQKLPWGFWIFYESTYNIQNSFIDR